MSETTDIDALIADARSYIKNNDGSHGSAPSLVTGLADALESVQAELWRLRELRHISQRERKTLESELREERERANRLDSDHTDSEKALIDSVNALEADLARAQEVIETVREQAQSLVDQPGPGEYYTGQEMAGESFLEILATYDKEGNDDE